MIRPRRRVLALGFLLMVISRPCGLVLPASTRYLIDNVIGKKQIQLLLPLVLIVLAATVIQGVTSSFALTQLVSKAGQRLIAELRAKGAGARRPFAGGLLRRQQDRNAGVAHHDRRGRHPQSAGHGVDRIRGRHTDRGAGAGFLLHINCAADDHCARHRDWIRAGAARRRSASSGRFSASAARSTRK